jgi:hypothetical protein
VSDERFAKYDRVSDILSPFSGYDVIPKLILENACERGKRVHTAISMHINSMLDWESNNDIQGYVDSFSKFMDSTQILLRGDECRYFRYDITGQMDLIAEIDDKMVLIDWKTSAKEGKMWRYQAAAYRMILEGPENLINQGTQDEKIVPADPICIDESWFVKLNKNGDPPEIYKYGVFLEDHLADLDTFMACREVYKRFYKNKTLSYEVD